MSRVSKHGGKFGNDKMDVNADFHDLPWEEQTSQMMPTKRPSALDLFAAAIPKAMAEATAKQLVMIEKAKVKTLEPWEQCPDVWKTKPAFFQWVRGQMRRAWARHPVKVSYMHNHRERVPLGKKTVKNPKGLVWGCRCEHCNNLFKQTECEVDHIEQAGSFKDWGDLEKWMVKLMHINWGSIRVVCKTCHRIKSYAERTGMTFEEAKLEKEVIAFTKTKLHQQQSVMTLIGSDATNAKQRRAAYKKYLQEKLNGST